MGTARVELRALSREGGGGGYSEMGLEERSEVATGAEFLLNAVVAGDGAVEQGERWGGLE